jgi:hypothetical protein
VDVAAAIAVLLVNAHAMRTGQAQSVALPFVILHAWMAEHVRLVIALAIISVCALLITEEVTVVLHIVELHAIACLAIEVSVFWVEIMLSVNVRSHLDGNHLEMEVAINVRFFFNVLVNFTNFTLVYSLLS